MALKSELLKHKLGRKTLRSNESRHNRPIVDAVRLRPITGLDPHLKPTCQKAVLYDWTLFESDMLRLLSGWRWELDLLL